MKKLNINNALLLKISLVLIACLAITFIAYKFNLLGKKVYDNSQIYLEKIEDNDIVSLENLNKKLELDNAKKLEYTEMIYSSSIFSYNLYNEAKDIDLNLLVHHLKEPFELTNGEILEYFKDDSPFDADKVTNEDQLSDFINSVSRSKLSDYYMSATGQELNYDNTEDDLLNCTVYAPKYDSYIHYEGHGTGQYSYDIMTKLTSYDVTGEYYFNDLKAVYDLSNDVYRFVFDSYMSDSETDLETLVEKVDNYLNGDSSAKDLSLNKLKYSDTFVMRKSGNDWYFVSHNVYLND